MEQETRKGAVKIETPYFTGRYENGKQITGIEEAVEYLQECKKNGQNVYIIFNGHKLYSCDVTVDSAYMEVTGLSKKENDTLQEEFAHAETSEEKRMLRDKWEDIRAENIFQLRIEKGKKLIYPELALDWEDFVAMAEPEEGRLIDNVLEIMEGIDNDVTMEELKSMLREQSHSGASESYVRGMALRFSKQGPSFYRNTARRPLTQEEEEAIKNIEIAIKCYEENEQDRKDGNRRKRQDIPVIHIRPDDPFAEYQAELALQKAEEILLLSIEKDIPEEIIAKGMQDEDDQRGDE